MNLKGCELFGNICKTVPPEFFKLLFKNFDLSWGAVHKRRTQSGWGCPARISRDQCGHPHYLVQKKLWIIHWNLWCIRTDRGWGSHMDKGGRRVKFFAILCGFVYGRSLSGCP